MRRKKISCQAGFLKENTVFLLTRHHPPQKLNGRPLKSTNYLLSWQILICLSFLKPFETTGTKLSRGDGRNTFLLTSTRRVLTDGRSARCATSWPNFLFFLILEKRNFQVLINIIWTSLLTRTGQVFSVIASTFLKLFTFLTRGGHTEGPCRSEWDL